MTCHQPGSALFFALALGAAFQAHAADPIRWRNIGPGGGGAWLGAARIHPRNPDIVFMGTDVGGIFRTRDGGHTWEIVNRGLADQDVPAHVYYTYDVVFDPSDPQTIYLGTDGGLFKSRDGGDSWRSMMRGDWRKVAAIVIDPSNPARVYAASDRGGVLRSTDGFATYQGVSLPSCTEGASREPVLRSLVLNPGSRESLVACTDCGIYESTDSGQGWAKLRAAGLPHPDCNRLVLAPGPSLKSASTLYLTVNSQTVPTDPGDPNSWAGGVYRSTDGGQTWLDASGSVQTIDSTSFEEEAPGRPAPSWSYTSDNSTARRFCGPPSEVDAHSGSCSIRIGPSRSGGGGIISESFAVRPGERYRVSVWARVEGVSADGDSSLLLGRIFWYTEDPASGRIERRYWDSGCSHYSHVNLWIYHEAGFLDWRQFERVVEAPPGAVYAKLIYFTSDTVGTTWLDDSKLERYDRLPRVSGSGESFKFANYLDLAADPLQPGTLYVATARSSFSNDAFAGDMGGVWKTQDGGEHWRLVTTDDLQDNVENGRGWTPACGNNLCEKPDEDCSVCPADCCPGVPPDCDQTRTWTTVGGYHVWSLTARNGIVYFGDMGFLYRSLDAGRSWTEVSGVPDPSGDPSGRSWRGAGATNNVVVYDVRTDTRAAGRLYYGDADNSLQISTNALPPPAPSPSFIEEGQSIWETLGRFAADGREICQRCGVRGGGVTSILVDPLSADTVYCGVYLNDVYGGTSLGLDDGGIVRGDQANGIWKWRPLGGSEKPGSLMRGGPLYLALDAGESPRAFFAAIYGKGLYRSTDEGATWASLTADPSHWSPAPGAWNIYQLKIDPASRRIYVGLGNPLASCPTPVRGCPSRQAAGDTGVWASDDGGASWTKISSAEMDHEPVLWLEPRSRDEILAGTWSAQAAAKDLAADGWRGEGGLYLGRLCSAGSQLCGARCQGWTWRRVLALPKVTGAAVSPFNASVIFAAAAQVGVNPAPDGQGAGVYRSLDGGCSWDRLANQSPDPLMNLASVRLFFSASDPLTLYAATSGDGLFEGRLACDHDGVCEADEVCGLCDDCICGRGGLPARPHVH